MSNTRSSAIAGLAVVLALLVFAPVGLAEEQQASAVSGPVLASFAYKPCIGAPVVVQVSGGTADIGVKYSARFEPISSESKQIISLHGELPAVFGGGFSPTGRPVWRRLSTKDGLFAVDSFYSETIRPEHAGEWKLTLTPFQSYPIVRNFVIDSKCTTEQQIGLRVVANPSPTNLGMMDLTATVNEGVSPLYWAVNGLPATFVLGGENVYYATISPANLASGMNEARLIAKLGKTSKVITSATSCEADVIPDGCYASPLPLGGGNVCSIIRDSLPAGTTRVCLANGQQSTQQLCCSSAGLAPTQADVTSKFAVAP